MEQMRQSRECTLSVLFFAYPMIFLHNSILHYTQKQADLFFSLILQKFKLKTRLFCDILLLRGISLSNLKRQGDFL